MFCFFYPHAVQVFSSYIQCHLATPKGIRKLIANGMASHEENEISEYKKDGQDQILDQLASVVMLGRIAVERCIPHLTRYT